MPSIFAEKIVFQKNEKSFHKQQKLSKKWNKKWSSMSFAKNIKTFSNILFVVLRHLGVILCCEFLIRDVSESKSFRNNNSDACEVSRITFRRKHGGIRSESGNLHKLIKCVIRTSITLFPLSWPHNPKCFCWWLDGTSEASTTTLTTKSKANLFMFCRFLIKFDWYKVKSELLPETSNCNCKHCKMISRF